MILIRNGRGMQSLLQAVRTHGGNGRHTAGNVILVESVVCVGTQFVL